LALLARLNISSGVEEREGSLHLPRLDFSRLQVAEHGSPDSAHSAMATFDSLVRNKLAPICTDRVMEEEQGEDGPTGGTTACSSASSLTAEQVQSMVRSLMLRARPITTSMLPLSAYNPHDLCSASLAQARLRCGV
jgi:hypothetical protein